MKELFVEYGMTFVWLGIAIATFVVESLTSDMVAIWFTPGAIVAMVLSFWVDLIWVQVLVFLVLSTALLILTRLYYKKHPMSKRGEAMNADSVIGARGIVQETVDNLHGKGSIKVGSLVWTARSTDDSIIPEGATVIVREISGVKLICEPESAKPE